MQRRYFASLLLGSLAASSVAQSHTSAANGAETVTPEEVTLPFKNHGKGVTAAPFGGSVSPAIANYNRVSPYIANAGLLHAGGLEEAKLLGFALIIDLRGRDEKGVHKEAQLARDININYQNIPITSRAPRWSQVEHFAAIVHNAAHYPILVHCVSSNRSGAIWAMYRASIGIPPYIAVEEGRAAGLESREKAVRKMLDLEF